jgi:hypothetical protein
MKHTLPPWALSILILAACARLLPSPTPTTAPTPTKVPPTATASNTSTPEPAATKEIKQYAVCRVGNYKDCVIPLEDLFDGSYLMWLGVLSKPFDSPQNLEPLVAYPDMSGSAVWFGAMSNTTPSMNHSFSDPATAPLRRGVTVGYIDPNPEVNLEYAIVPIEFYCAKSPSRSVWVIFVIPDTSSAQQAVFKQLVTDWQSSDSLGIYQNDGVYGNTAGWTDPLVARSFQLHPDLAVRIRDFGNSGDASPLSVPGIVLEAVLPR